MTPVNALEMRALRRGIATMCIGVEQGSAMPVERV